ncbi:hypothetical protein GUJ93_ZPchr0002g26078 [Zizania palustris]|uniref:Uncharacterized protein n=1 Tax=Zizania palustris TaxID=103762 RepID=A0A8J5SSR5_ZIZPA|nr:hypothetical protein GUJ93_ZPchr0002g26078 [Zizania palustris]
MGRLTRTIGLHGSSCSLLVGFLVYLRHPDQPAPFLLPTAGSTGGLAWTTGLHGSSYSQLVGYLVHLCHPDQPAPFLLSTVEASGGLACATRGSCYRPCRQPRGLLRAASLRTHTAIVGSSSMLISQCRG